METTATTSQVWLGEPYPARRLQTSCGREGAENAQDEDTQGNGKAIQAHRQGKTPPAQGPPQPPAPQKVQARAPIVRQGLPGAPSRPETSTATVGPEAGGIESRLISSGVAIEGSERKVMWAVSRSGAKSAWQSTSTERDSSVHDGSVERPGARPAIWSSPALTGESKRLVRLEAAQTFLLQL